MDASDFSVEEFTKGFANAYSFMLDNPVVAPQSKPRAFLLGGQSGAGKTTLHRVCSQELDSNALIVNGDEYRSYHPRYREIGKKYGLDAPAHTAAWAGRMVEAIVDAASRAKYNLIVEGTLRTAEVPLKTATLLKERGYSVSLALMAVKPEISLLSCELRWEQMRLAGTLPRAVDPNHHRAIVDAIVSNLAQLEKSNLFDRIELYGRDGSCLYEANDAHAIEGGLLPSEALGGILFGDWSKQEQAHYTYLEKQLEEARAQ